MYTSADHTFVLCAYKESPFLENAIESLEQQIERSNILISTSTPNTFISSVGQAHNIPIVVNPHPHHLGDDWNFGFDSAKTSLVTITHQDDIYGPDFLKETLTAINNYPDEDVLALFTDYYEIRNDLNVDNNTLLNVKRIMNAPFKHPFLNKSSFIRKGVLRFGNPICCPSVTLCKPNVGPSVYDTTLNDSCDYKTWVNLSSKAGRFVYIPKKLMGHRIHQESATTTHLNEGLRKHEGQIIFETFWPRPIARILNKVYSLAEKSNDLNR